MRVLFENVSIMLPFFFFAFEIVEEIITSKGSDSWNLPTRKQQVWLRFISHYHRLFFLRTTRTDSGSIPGNSQQKLIESITTMETNTNFQKHKVVSRSHSTSSRSSDDSTSPPSTSDSGSEDDSSNNSSHSSSSAAEEYSSNRNSSSSGSSKTSSSDDSSSSGSSSSSSSSDEEDHADDVRFENAAHIPIEYFADIPMRMANLHLIAGHGQRGIVKEWSTQLGCWVSRQTMVLMFHKAFARGCMRSSYHLIDLQCPSKNFVAKQYRKKTVVPSQYFDDVAMHSIAEYWALQFNTAGAPKRVRFVPAAVLELPFLSPPLIFAIEPHLVGEFKKHNNNNGYVAEDKRNTPQAFSHYTFHKSQGQLLIVDIQGVGDDYTDPQIMSLDGEGYGRGNLGTKGMEKFLKTHQCNAVCEHLALPRISSKNVRVNKAGEPKQHRKKKPKAKHSPKQGVAGSGGSPKLPKVTSTEFPTPRSGRKPPRHTPKRQTSAADDLCNVSTPTTSTENMARLHDDVTMGNPSPQRRVSTDPPLPQFLPHHHHGGSGGKEFSTPNLHVKHAGGGAAGIRRNQKVTGQLRHSILELRGGNDQPLISIAPPPTNTQHNFAGGDTFNANLSNDDVTLVDGGSMLMMPLGDFQSTSFDHWGTLSFVESGAELLQQQQLEQAYAASAVSVATDGEKVALEEEYQRLLERQARRKAEKDAVLVDGDC